MLAALAVGCANVQMPGNGDGCTGGHKEIGSTPSSVTVNQALFRFTWYRIRASIGRQWGGYLAIVLLVGLLGGLAMGAISTARRTQSFFPSFLAGTNPSNLVVSLYVQ